MSELERLNYLVTFDIKPTLVIFVDIVINEIDHSIDNGMFIFRENKKLRS